MAFERALPLNELWEGEMRSVRVAGRRVLLVRHAAEGVCAYEDRCAHLGVPLSEGFLEHDVITCRVHGWSYDARSGRGVNPASACLKRFALELRDGEVWVDAELEQAYDGGADENG